MPSSPEFIATLLDRLTPLGNIRAKAMFGGHGVYVNECFCMIVADDLLFAKVDDVTRPRYIEQGMGPFVPDGYGGKPMKGYYQLPDEALEDDALLMELIAEAEETAVRAKR